MTFPQSVPLVRANTSYYPQVLTHEISYTESDAGGIGESSVDVDPMNSSIFAVAALNFYGPFRTEGFPAFYSMDSGATWTEVGLAAHPCSGIVILDSTILRSRSTRTVTSSWAGVSLSLHKI